jgi:hypothetical protein
MNVLIPNNPLTVAGVLRASFSIVFVTNVVFEKHKFRLND